MGTATNRTGWLAQHRSRMRYYSQIRHCTEGDGLRLVFTPERGPTRDSRTGHRPYNRRGPMGRTPGVFRNKDRETPGWNANGPITTGRSASEAAVATEIGGRSRKAVSVHRGGAMRGID
jgi:hypothetical protein